MAARWHLSDDRSYREVVVRLAERNIQVDRATVHRWIIRHRSRGDTTQSSSRGRADGPCRLEEVQFRLGDEDYWLYRARDPNHRVVDVYLLGERDEGAARRFFEDTGELRVWEQQEGGEDDEPEPAASIEEPVPAVQTGNIPVLDMPAAVAEPPLTRLPTRIEPWLRMRPGPAIDGQAATLARPPRNGPYIRTEQRDLRVGKPEPDTPPTIIEAKAVPTPSPDPADSTSVPTLTRRAYTWILGARRSGEKP